MRFNRVWCNDQRIRNLTIRLALGDQSGHSTFALGQSLEGRFRQTMWRGLPYAREQCMRVLQKMLV